MKVALHTVSAVIIPSLISMTNGYQGAVLMAANQQHKTSKPAFLAPSAMPETSSIPVISTEDPTSSAAGMTDNSEEYEPCDGSPYAPVSMREQKISPEQSILSAEEICPKTEDFILNEQSLPMQEDVAVSDLSSSSVEDPTATSTSSADSTVSILLELHAAEPVGGDEEGMTYY